MECYLLAVDRLRKYSVVCIITNEKNVIMIFLQKKTCRFNAFFYTFVTIIQHQKTIISNK